MNNQQVAHTWAQQNRPRATGSNFFFEGPSIYSYGRHFEIARFVEHDGRRCVLFTSRAYSQSTSRHKLHTSRALDRTDVPVFTVPVLNTHDHAHNLSHYRAEVETLVRQAYKARKHAAITMMLAHRMASEANAYAEFFGLPDRLPLPEFDDETRERLRQYEEARKAEIQRRREVDAQRQADLIADESASLTLWREGIKATIYTRFLPTALRVQAGLIQTSRGAEFPVSHGTRAFRFIERVRASGEGWQRNGHTIHLGHFQIDRIDPDGTVHAGCHTVAWDEIEACARKLGLLGSQGVVA